MEKKIKTSVFENALDITCHLPVSPYTIVENTLWNLLHDRIALLTLLVLVKKNMVKN